MEAKTIPIKIDKTLQEMLVASSVIYFISACMKLFAVPYPEHYSDITWVWYRTFILYGIPHGAIPYVSFGMEYPVLIGVLFYVSTLSPNYGWTMFLLLAPFALGVVYFLYQICKLLNIDSQRIFFFMIFTPSWLIFSFYNWDLVAVFFALMAIYLHMKKREKMAGVAIGLGIGAKIYPLLVLPLLLQDQKSWRTRFETTFLAFATFFLLNLPFAILNFAMLWDTYIPQMYIRGSIIENTWWRFVPLSMEIIKPLSAILFVLLFLFILRKGVFIEKFWMIYAAMLLTYPTYAPQFNLTLLPFFVLNPAFSLIPFYIFDAMNALIILMWFSFPPLPIWILGVLRQAFLLVLLISFIRPQTNVRQVWKWLTSPVSPITKEVIEEVEPLKEKKKRIDLVTLTKKMIKFLTLPIEEEKKEGEKHAEVS